MPNLLKGGARMTDECQLCAPREAIFEDEHAYVAMDANALGPGYVIIVPKRHVENFFDMNRSEKSSVLTLLDITKEDIDEKLKPDGYNIGVNIARRRGRPASTPTFISFHGSRATLPIHTAVAAASYRSENKQ